MRNAEPHGRSPDGQFSGSDSSAEHFPFRRSLHRLAAELDAPGLCRCDSLGLPLFDEGSLRLGNIAEQLQHDIGNQSSGQIPVFRGIQQRHVQHNDSDALFRQLPPGLQDLVIVPSQAVNAHDGEGVSGFHAILQPQPDRPVHVPAGFLLADDVRRKDPGFFHGFRLPVEVLVLGADPAVCKI